MRSRILIVPILILSACNHVKTFTPIKDSIPTQNTKNAPKKISTGSTKIDSVGFKNKLLGLWALKGSENATFDIKKSTIYYPEHFKSYKYKINGDSIKIYYDGFDETFAYHLKSDTLTMSGDDGNSNYYRVRK